jgi:hypothetical protein
MPTSMSRGRSASAQPAAAVAPSEEEAALWLSLTQAHVQIESQAHALEQAAAETAEWRARAKRAEQAELTLQHRLGALGAEVRVARTEAYHARQEVAHRDAEQRRREALERAAQAKALEAAGIDAVDASEAGGSAGAEALRAQLQGCVEEMERLRAEAADARAQAERWLAALAESREAEREARAAAQSHLEDGNMLRRRVSEQQGQARVWAKERAALLSEVDRNASGAIRRREELYFTRTNMLKEQLRLRGELERIPLPLPSSPPPHSCESAAPRHPKSPPSPRTARAASATARPSPRGKPTNALSAAPAPPPTFVHGLSPRAPNSPDNRRAFSEQVMLEYRAAQQAPRALSAVEQHRTISAATRATAAGRPTAVA